MPLQRIPGVSENLSREVAKLLTGRSAMDGWQMLAAARAIVWLLESHKERQGIYCDYQEPDNDSTEDSPVGDD